eukprot:scaffold16117_cov48-Phaeocystis_antarctica.AAC.1
MGGGRSGRGGRADVGRASGGGGGGTAKAADGGRGGAGAGAAHLAGQRPRVQGAHRPVRRRGRGARGAHHASLTLSWP